MMRKRKPGYYPKDEEKDWAGVAFVLAFPLVAVALSTFVLVSNLTPDKMSIWVALPVVFIGSSLVLACGIISSGDDTSDIIVPSLVVIALSLLLWPTLSRAKVRRLESKGLATQQTIQE